MFHMVCAAYNDKYMYLKIYYLASSAYFASSIYNDLYICPILYLDNIFYFTWLRPVKLWICAAVLPSVLNRVGKCSGSNRLIFSLSVSGVNSSKVNRGYRFSEWEAHCYLPF